MCVNETWSSLTPTLGITGPKRRWELSQCISTTDFFCERNRHCHPHRHLVSQDKNRGGNRHNTLDRSMTDFFVKESLSLSLTPTSSVTGQKWSWE